jgi:hypothetical protein
MNDNDFQDIGKRLYDLEADPPRDGWDKISPAIKVAPAGNAWFRKNWWKPFVLLIPVSAYLLFSDGGLNDMKLASSVSASIHEQKQNSKNTVNPVEALKPQIRKGGQQEVETQNKTSEQQHIDKKIKPKENAIVKKDSDVGVNRDEKTATNTFGIRATVVSTDVNTENEEKPFSLEVRSGKTSDMQADTKFAGQSSVNNLDEPILDDEALHTNNVDKNSAEVNLSTTDPSVLDTAVMAMEEKKLDERLSVTTENRNEDKPEENKLNAWRITATVNPQYVAKAVKPVTDDDIFVTAIDDKNKTFIKRIGLGVALGAGKAIGSNWYIDGQLSFSKMQQDIGYSSSTGQVDTLLAVQQPDQSVRVVPVYTVVAHEIANNYSYAGLKLGGTFYFWSNARRRFNFTASAGFNYLVNAACREKIGNGEWISRSNTDLNKMSYTVSIGAGYNINLHRGWELMMSLALQYNIGKVNDPSLPYNLNQRSLGLNFMLSKSIGMK